MLTGYYTVNHFYRNPVEHIEKDAVDYTIQKYKGLAFYIIVCVTGEYILEIAYAITQGENVLDILVGFPIEIAGLTSAGFFYPKLVPLWYLSSMLIAMPVFIILLCKKRNLFEHVLSWMIPLMYYGIVGVTTKETGYLSILRAYSGMSLGAISFFIISNNQLQKLIQDKSIKIIEVVCYLYVIVHAYLNWHYENGVLYNATAILAMFIATTIMLSGHGIKISLCSERLVSYLGRLSLPLYLCHWVVASFINGISAFIGYEIAFGIKVLVFYTVSLITAAILLKLKTHIFSHEK